MFKTESLIPWLSLPLGKGTDAISGIIKERINSLLSSSSHISLSLHYPFAPCEKENFKCLTGDKATKRNKAQIWVFLILLHTEASVLHLVADAVVFHENSSA